jgi:TPR repeat protein
VIAAGDIEAGRFALSQMVESGNASAAVDLGSTYDPNILGALGVRNFPADVAKARVWYQKAQQMGAPEAVKLLESLESRGR